MSRRQRRSRLLLVFSTVVVGPGGCQAFLILDSNDSSQVVTQTDASGSDDARSDDAGARDDAGKIVSTGYAGAVLADSPVAYYRLGETTGSVAVDELGAHDGTYHGCTLGMPGVSKDGNTAAAFDGDAWIEATPAYRFGGSQPFTIEAWIAITPRTGGDRYIAARVSAAGGVRLTIRRPGDQFAFERFAAGTAEYAWSSTGVSEASFHHVVGVFSGGQLFVYLDGEPAGTAQSELNLPEEDAPFVIGARTTTPSDESFRGTIDEVAIYDKALTYERVLAHFKAGGAVN